MTAKPNAMGRIEGKPKDHSKRNRAFKVTALTTLALGLFLAGIYATIGYASFIERTQQEGVSQYKTNECQQYSNEDKSAKWLECEAIRVENNV